MYLKEMRLAALTKIGDLSDRAEHLPQPDFEYILSNSGSLRTFHIFQNDEGHSLECEIHFVPDDKYVSANFVVNDDNHEYFASRTVGCSSEGEPLYVVYKHDLVDRSKVHQSLEVPDWTPLIKDIMKFHKQIAIE